MLEKLTDPEEKRYRLFGHLPHSIIPLLQDTERPSQASVSSRTRSRPQLKRGARARKSCN